MNYTEMNPSANFRTYCELNQRRLCCGSWTLANLVARLAGLDSCSQLQESDLLKARSIVQTCAIYYPRTLQSDECTSEARLCGMEANTVCAEHRSTLFSLYHYLMDTQFVHGIVRSADIRLSKTAIFLPLAKSTHLLPYFESITPILDQHRPSWSFGDLQLTMPSLQLKSMDFGIYHSLFERHLLLDLRFAICICLIIFVYSRSFLLTIVIIAIVALSLLLAYYGYVYALGIEFFPFMNMFAVLIAIAIGADNAFIFIQEHRQQQKMDQSNQSGFIHLESYSTRTTLVGSLTTVCAYLCSAFYSHITAIRCFALFAALITACNFALTALFMPLCVQMVRRSAKGFSSTFPSSKSSPKTNSSDDECDRFYNDKQTMVFDSFSSRWLFALIRWFAFPLVFFLFSTAMVAYYLIFYYPQLRASTSQESPLFHSNHYFERYSESRSDFSFDRINRTISQEDQIHSYLMGQEGRARVIFGVTSHDSGFHLDPLDRGPLTFSSMGAFDPPTQRWLLFYCKALRNQSFYAANRLIQFSGCFMDSFRNWMSERRCDQSFGTENSFPCCNQTRFPFSVDIFQRCLVEYQQLLVQTPSQLVSRYGGVWFGRDDFKTNDISEGRFNFSQPRLLVIEFQLRLPMVQTHTTMASTWIALTNFHRSMLEKAPRHLRHGWAIADHVDYFAIRMALLDLVPRSIAIVACFSGLAIVLATRSLGLFVLTFISCSCSTGCAIALLVLLDWRLNVTEGVIISAVGLSGHYTLHYAICYKDAMQVSSI